MTGPRPFTIWVISRVGVAQGKAYSLTIRVTRENPPIPTRDHDYCAVDYATYDPEATSGRASLRGWGRTEALAVADLIDQWED